jgi:hypothetical protein
MLKLADYYEISLLGNDLDNICCPVETKGVIEKFREYESSGMNEHQIKAEIDVPFLYIRKLMKTYCSFNGLPDPKFIKNSCLLGK